jgi:succinate dehydrogenase / fumarate reductase, cytochrome b subunit
MYQKSPTQEWASNVVRYKKFTGSWAWLLHRLTGLGLTAYVLVHIHTLSSLQQGPEAFNAKMEVFMQPLWLVGAWLLFGLVIFHTLNGIRIAIIDFGRGAKYHKQLLYGAVAVGLVLFLWMGYIIFFGQADHGFLSHVLPLR